MATNYHNFRGQFGDTTFTKVFVGGLAWETETAEMRRYFDQFGDILEAAIITDKHTGKSKGYGFVTFRDSESARRACVDPNPVIDGRRANCNIASLGRPRPSPPRGRNHGGGDSPYQTQRGVPPTASSSYARTAVPQPTPPPPAIYPPYGYAAYGPDYWYQHQLLQQPQYYSQQQLGTTSSGAGPPFYGYTVQPPSPRGPYPSSPQAHRMAGPPYLYYSTQMGSFPGYHRPPSPTLRLQYPSPPAESGAPEEHQKSPEAAEAKITTASETASPPYSNT